MCICSRAFDACHGTAVAARACITGLTVTGNTGNTGPIKRLRIRPTIKALLVDRLYSKNRFRHQAQTKNVSLSLYKILNRSIGQYQ